MLVPGLMFSIYGVASSPASVLGFRLFPNPEFNEAARKQWDGERYVRDPTYYNNNQLVRPYRVGVACGSCHIAPHPTHPPDDPENPRWENLASAIGNQYIDEGKVFACNVEKGGFFHEMLANQPRGTSDTSRIATDHINNPNAINPIFLLAERERIETTEKLGPHTLSALGQPAGGGEMKVAHILKDGADSIGVPGATIRVFINIGMFSEYWLTRHNRLIGLVPQQPFEIEYAHENSVFWQATEQRLANIAAFFRRLQPELPILVLSARTGSSDKVSALDLGAVDYVTKPFSMDELLARLRAALRRSTIDEPPAPFSLGKVVIDVAARLIRPADGTPADMIHLTPTEWRMLEVLLRNPGSLVTTAELLTAMRGQPEHTERSYLRIYMQQLRRKLEIDPARPRHLLTEPGMGYRYMP